MLILLGTRLRYIKASLSDDTEIFFIINVIFSNSILIFFIVPVTCLQSVKRKLFPPLFGAGEKGRRMLTPKKKNRNEKFRFYYE